MTSEPRVGRYLIYGLLDPRDSTLRYIGKTHKRREIRLREHLEAAEQGRTTPVYRWIRALQSAGFQPMIFVLARIPPGSDWRESEARAIYRWRSWPSDRLPYVHPPQTPKSVPVEIHGGSLLNVQPGGS